MDGYPYEMGGTWVYWGQPNVWREILRYQMQDEIEISYDFSKGLNKYVIAGEGTTQEVSHEEEVCYLLPLTRVYRMLMDIGCNHGVWSPKASQCRWPTR